MSRYIDADAFEKRMIKMFKCVPEIGVIPCQGEPHTVYLTEALKEEPTANIKQVIISYGIKVNKEEVEKALQYNQNQYDKGYMDGKYNATPHAYWYILKDCSNEGVYCSHCHKKCFNKEYYAMKQQSKFCPNCGAIMDEKK